VNDRPDPPDDPDQPESSGERGLDVDAAFEAIVANFGAVPPVAEGSDQPGGGRPSSHSPAVDEPDRSRPMTEEPDEGGRPEAPGGPPDPDRLRGLFRPAWDDPVVPDEEEHFVPPPPPPIPAPEPRRRVAWTGLFGGPALMLFAIVTGTSLPGWVMFLLSAGFVGGFVYLIATMNDSGRGHRPGDDGAVV
jgi:hypothetical protein